MSVNNNDLIGLANAIEEMIVDIPEIMSKIAVGEGMYARDQARKICTEDGIVNTGDYRRNFKCGTRAIRTGNSYKIDVFNNLDYAKPLEYGFRGHFVPGHWDGNSFVYQRNDPEGGMYVHFTPGHYTLKRAIDKTKRSQDQRIQRKYLSELRKRGISRYADIR